MKKKFLAVMLCILYDYEKECTLVLEDFIQYKLDRDIL